MKKPPDLLPGTLDLLVLRTLTRGPLHGYGIEVRFHREAIERDQIAGGHSPRDPLVFGPVVVALLLVATVASLVPAIRGARVDPNAALRAD